MENSRVENHVELRSIPDIWCIRSELEPLCCLLEVFPANLAFDHEIAQGIAVPFCQLLVPARTAAADTNIDTNTLLIPRDKKPAILCQMRVYATACYVLLLETGAACRNRTDDLPLTRRLLYQLS
jgi:hypothetical protein